VTPLQRWNAWTAADVVVSNTPGRRGGQARPVVSIC
jgi:hypothetical protein